MTISFLALIVLIVLVITIIRGDWLWSAIIIVFIACSSSMVATDLKTFWHDLQTERVKL